MIKTCSHLTNIPIYQPGEVDRLSSQVIKLSSNENVYGTSPRVYELLKNHFFDLERYPDGQALSLRQSLSDQLLISSDCFLFGNGSNDLIELIAKAFVSSGDKILSFQYSFVVYRIVSYLVNASYEEVDVLDDFGMNIDLMIQKQLSARLIFIASPNNPTGQSLSFEDIRTLLESCSDQTLVVVDEAYIEYAEAFGKKSVISLVRDYSNLIVLRTFSKAYGLASLRVGYAVSHPDIIQGLNSIRQPFNVGGLSQTLVQEALTDFDFIQQSVQFNKDVMKYFCQKLKPLNRVTCYSSCANFVLLRVDILALDFFNQLKSKGFLVRPLHPYGLLNHVRVTIGTKEQMKTLANLIEEWNESSH